MKLPKRKKNDRSPNTVVPKSFRKAEQPSMKPSDGKVAIPADASSIPNGKEIGPIICQHYTNGNNAIDCKGHHTGLLTGEEIKRYGVLVSEDRDDSACLQATSYDLRLGEGHMVYEYSGKERQSWLVRWFSSKEQQIWLATWVSTDPCPIDGNPLFIKRGTSLRIPAFGMALIQLRERVDLLSCIKDPKQPVMICGHFDLKLSRVKEGLISQQATQVEPGYQGKLFCYLFNQTGDDIYLSYTDINNVKIATIEFQYVSCLSQCDVSIRDQLLAALPKDHKKYHDSSFCNDHGIDDVRFFEGQLPKHGGLSSIIQMLEDAEKKAFDGCSMAIRNAGLSRAAHWSLIVALLVFIFTLLQIRIDDGTFKKISELWSLFPINSLELKSLEKKSNAVRESLEKLRSESQDAYNMAKAELEELDRQKKESLQQKISSTTEMPKTSNVKTEKGDNQ